jgi:hypothetical protein
MASRLGAGEHGGVGSTYSWAGTPSAASRRGHRRRARQASPSGGRNAPARHRDAVGIGEAAVGVVGVAVLAGRRTAGGVRRMDHPGQTAPRRTSGSPAGAEQVVAGEEQIEGRLADALVVGSATGSALRRVMLMAARNLSNSALAWPPAVTWSSTDSRNPCRSG